MKIAIFSSQSYDRDSFTAANSGDHELTFLPVHLNEDTVGLARGFEGVCAFVNDRLSKPVLQKLADFEIRLVALRSAGFNHVDLPAAQQLGITIVRVPAYSPHAVAEHAVALILTLNRKLYRAYNRVRDDNFSLEGLTGFDLYGCTVGVIGTGQIGQCFAQIMQGFGTQVLGYDLRANPQFEALPHATYTTLENIWQQSDIISLHCPLTSDNYHLVNQDTIGQCKPGVMLINTSRGGLVDTAAVIQGIKSGQIGYLGIDVYEQEADLFFADLSDQVIQDDTFQLLQSFPNVVITAHQAFLTRNALHNIATTTLGNITAFASGQVSGNEVTV